MTHESPLGRAARHIIETAPMLAQSCLAIWRWQNQHDHLGKRGPFPAWVSDAYPSLRLRRLVNVSTNRAGAVRRISLTQVGSEVALRMQKKEAK